MLLGKLTIGKGEKGERGLTGNQGIQGKTGKQGEKGEKGADGITPSFSVGNVERLPITKEPQVYITGTKENIILNFGIPCNTQKLILQSDFSTLNGWSEYVDGSNALATFSIEEDMVKVNIGNGGSEKWHIQFTKSDLQIIKNKTYEYNVTLVSNIKRKIGVGMQNKETYEPYFNTSVEVEADEEVLISNRYHHNLTSDLNTNFILFLGSEGGEVIQDNTIYIKDINIVEID